MILDLLKHNLSFIIYAKQFLNTSTNLRIL